MIERALDRAVGGLTAALGLLFIAAVLLNVANVVARYGFGGAIFGADEVQTYAMVWMAFVGAAAVTWRGAHLRMDVLVAYLPSRARTALRVVEFALVIATALFVLAQSWQYCVQMAQMGRRSDAAGIPMAIPHAALVVGFALIALAAAWRFARPQPPPGTMEPASPGVRPESSPTVVPESPPR
jgi:C4-dicarboxylate transporter DctQ subunit